MFSFSVSEARTDDLVKDYIQQGMEQVNEEAISRSTRVQVGEVHVSSFVCTIYILYCLYKLQSLKHWMFLLLLFNIFLE